MFISYDLTQASSVLIKDSQLIYLRDKVIKKKKGSATQMLMKNELFHNQNS